MDFQRIFKNGIRKIKSRKNKTNSNERDIQSNRKRVQI